MKIIGLVCFFIGLILGVILCLPKKILDIIINCVIDFAAWGASKAYSPSTVELMLKKALKEKDNEPHQN